MKPLLPCLLATALLAAPTVHAKPEESAASETAPAKLEPGASVTPDAFGKMEWIQGEGPKAWEPGKVYIFECWATWCGPCIAAIPHVNELHKKYAEKGLRVHGINVWERGPKEKVEKFVKGKGDGMSYPVAYSKEGDAFETGWLKPAGVNGIPHAFVVADGKLLFSTHPMKLTDEVIENLLAGGDRRANAVKGVAEKETREKKANAPVSAFYKALRGNQPDAMETQIKALEEIDKDSSYLPNMRLNLAASRKQWSEVETMISNLKEGGDSIRFAMDLDRQEVEAPEGVRKALVKQLKATKEAANPYVGATLARLQWSVGDKEAAVATAKGLAANPDKLPAKPFERFAAALEKGENPTMGDLYKWINEETKETSTGE